MIGINYYDYFENPDAMIHLAWEGLPNYKAAFHVEENLPRHYCIFKKLIEHGLTDITVTGTCFEYGMQEGCLIGRYAYAAGQSICHCKRYTSETIGAIATTESILL